MVRSYIRKTTRQSWEEIKMDQAIAAIKGKEMGYLKASIQFGVPRTTLERRVKSKNILAKGSLKKLGSFSTTFTVEMEDDLCTYILSMEERLFGLSYGDVRDIAFKFAEKNGIEHQFKGEKAGQDWLLGFMKRHPQLALRTPEQTSFARATAFNRNNIDTFFDLLGKEMDKHKFSADNIYNVDETGMSTVQNKPPKIIAQKGKKRVGVLTSAERGTLITAEICCNAAGTYVPPLMIFPRVRMRPELEDGAPHGTVFCTHPSGWMQTDIFTKWFRHFITFAKPSPTKPVLLILDGHATHTKNLEVIDMARQNNVIILCLPPHCTHRMQPLDVTFMKPLSLHFNIAVTKWLRSHPGKVVTQYSMARIFGEAYTKAATMDNAVNGFKAAGIFPFNPDIFKDEDFVAANTTENPLPALVLQSTSALSETTPEIGVDAISMTDREAALPVTSAVTVVQANDPVTSSDVPKIWNQVVRAVPVPSVTIMDHLASKNAPFITVTEIAPVPVASFSGISRPSRRKGKAAVITGSPYKSELELIKLGKPAAAPSVKPKRKVDQNPTNTSIKAKRRKTSKPKKHKPKSKDDDDTCLYCGITYCNSTCSWIKCQGCGDWACCPCAGKDEDENKFMCEICM